MDIKGSNTYIKSKKKKRRKKTWKIILLIVGIIIFLSFLISFGSKLSGPKKEDVDLALFDSYQKTESEKSLSSDYVPAVIENMITDRVSYEIMDISDDTITLEIAAPNMSEVFRNTTFSDKEVADGVAEYMLIESYVKDTLERNYYSAITNQVTLTIQEMDGNVRIIPTEEYMDAVYGGMVSYYKQIMSTRNTDIYANDTPYEGAVVNNTGGTEGAVGGTVSVSNGTSENTSANVSEWSMNTGSNAVQQDDVVRMIPCINNMSELTVLRVFPFQNDGRLYITASDAAALSGYELTSNGIQCKFQREGKEVVSSQALSFRDERWVQLEDTLQLLETEVMKVSDGLIIRGKETTAEELLAITDSIMLEDYIMYQVTDTYGFAGNIGYIAANIYNIVSQGKLFSRLTGDYSESLYESIFSGLSDVVATEGILSVISEANSLINKLDKIADVDMIGTDETQDLMELLADGAISDSTVVIKTLKNGTNPVKEVFKILGAKDGQISSYLELKGLDIGSQIKLYQYVESLANCSETYANMIAYTYSDYMIDEREDYYLPYTALGPVNDLKDFYYSEDFAELLLLYVSEERELVVADTMASIFDDMMINTIMENLLSSSAAKAVPLAQWITSSVFDLVFDDVSSKMNYIELSRCVSELQTGVAKLYQIYRANPETAINAKYAAMLYLSLYEFNHQMAVSSGVLKQTTAVSGICKKNLQVLAGISDRDLTVSVGNEHIDWMELFETQVNVSDEEESDVAEDSSFYELSTQDKIWKCANLLEKILYRNSEIYSVRILSEGNAYMETAALMWNLYGNNNGELLSVNDSWISEYDVVLKTSSSADTVYFEIVPMVEFGRFEGETYWYDGLNWMYDWEGNLIDSGVNYGLEEGIMYALRENGYSY